jgi:TetR/AcrR family transcriptional repressor of nem operon
MNGVIPPRGLATREDITRAAEGEFALKGYHDTTLEGVRRAADVSTGAFFHHFASNEDLGFAVLDRHMEKRRQELDRLEQGLPAARKNDPLERVFRRLDAVAQIVSGRRKGGCIIGQLSTSLSDSHEAVRQWLAKCFDEIALEFEPHLEAAVKLQGSGQLTDATALARYIVAIIEGSIMLARTQRNPQELANNFENLKKYLKQVLGA